MTTPHKPDSSITDLWTPEVQPFYIIDWDSTLCQKETLDFVAELALSGAELEKFQECTDQGMGGNLSFSDSLAQRFAMLRVRRDQVEQAGLLLADHIDPTAIERRSCIEKNRDRIYVVSGGFEELIMPSLSQLGIREDHVHANRFVYDEKDYVIGADPERLTCRDGGKADQVEALGLEGLTIVIGDGYNDYLIKERGCADIFIAYVRHKTRENVVLLADGVTDSFTRPLLT